MFYWYWYLSLRCLPQSATEFLYRFLHSSSGFCLLLGPRLNQMQPEVWSTRSVRYDGTMIFNHWPCDRNSYSLVSIFDKNADPSSFFIKKNNEFLRFSGIQWGICNDIFIWLFCLVFRKLFAFIIATHSAHYYGPDETKCSLKHKGSSLVWVLSTNIFSVSCALFSGNIFI